MAKKVFYDQLVTVGRKCVYSWRPSQRWPETHHMTHASGTADQQVFQGLVFRSAADADAHDITALDPVFGPQPFTFHSWQMAEMWVKEEPNYERSTA